jgi:hypothetical protein
MRVGTNANAHPHAHPHEYRHHDSSRVAHAYGNNHT